MRAPVFSCMCVRVCVWASDYNAGSSVVACRAASVDVAARCLVVVCAVDVFVRAVGADNFTLLLSFIMYVHMCVISGFLYSPDCRDTIVNNFGRSNIHIMLNKSKFSLEISIISNCLIDYYSCLYLWSD